MNENKNNVEGMINSTVEKMKAMSDADTIIGDPIVLSDNVKAIPVFKISYGFAAGGSDFATKNTQNKQNNFGGGGGGGMTVTPVAFLVCKNDEVQMLNVEAAAKAGNAGALGFVPELFDKVVALYKESKSKKDAAKTEGENKDNK